jgi:hypothetical protein
MPNEAAAHAPLPVTALERRYRRLLRWYPPSHRAAHREEMLGVLLDAARPGQRVPGVTQTVNLVACGLAIRARRALIAGPWQDALAVVSLIAPVLMLVIAALDLAEMARQAVAIYQAYPGEEGPFLTPDLVPQLGGPGVVMIIWLAVVILALTGRRRAAAAIASIALALALSDLLAVLIHQSGAWSGGLPMFLITAGQGPVFIASLAACSLAFSAGPRRGLAIVGRRPACLMIAALSGLFGVPEIVLMVRSSVPVAASTVSLLDVSVLTIAVAVVVTHVRDTVDRRVAALVAPVLLLDAASIPFEFKGISTATVVLSLASLLFAVLVWPVAIASWRGRVRRSSHALPA